MRTSRRGPLTVLLMAIVVVAVLMAAGSRLSQSRLGGRNVRTHRRALGRLATITADQPDRVEADVSQAHLHVRLVDEDPPVSTDVLLTNLCDRPGPVARPSRANGPLVKMSPPLPGETTSSGLARRSAALRATETDVSALPTGAVAALTRFAPAEFRSRRQRRRTGKTTARR